jgi:hypothetical protein
MGPDGQLPGISDPKRLAGAIGLHRDGAQHVLHFPGFEAAGEGDGPQVVTVQPAGELGEDRVAGIGGDAFDHELIARDAEREGGPVPQQCLTTPHDAGHRRPKRGVPKRIHGVLVERDRELDQEPTQFARQRGALVRHAARGGRSSGGRGHHLR